MTRRLKFEQDGNSTPPIGMKIYRNRETKEIAPGSLVEALENLKSFDKNFLSYLAGYTEADGCVHVGKGHPGIAEKTGRMVRYNISVVVTQKDPRPLFMFQEAFGGRLKPVIRKHVSGRKKYYQWILTANKAYACLYLLFPYLRFKQEQASVAMALQEDINNWKYGFSSSRQLPPPVREYRKSLYLRCKFLNSSQHIESISATLGEFGGPLYKETIPSEAAVGNDPAERVTARDLSPNDNDLQERPICISSQKEIA